MSRSTKRRSILILIVLTVAFAAHAAVNFYGPEELNKILQESVKNSCPSCKLEIADIEVSLVPPQVKLHSISFIGGDPKSTQVEFRIKLLTADISFVDLAQNIIKSEEIVITNLNINVLEGDLKNPKTDEEENNDSQLFGVERIKIVNSKFSYTREHLKKKAPIKIQNINATIEGIGNTKEFKDDITHGYLTARLERSGNIDLKVKSPLFAKDLSVDVDLTLLKQDLSRMNPYFTMNDGIQLAGKLLMGKSRVEVRGNKLNAFVQAEYEKLDFTFKKTKERTAASAFFSNLLASTQINKKNTDKKKKEQIEYKALNRKADQTLISFILNGMKEAALAVSTN